MSRCFGANRSNPTPACLEQSPQQHLVVERGFDYDHGPALLSFRNLREDASVECLEQSLRALGEALGEDGCIIFVEGCVEDLADDGVGNDGAGNERKGCVGPNAIAGALLAAKEVSSLRSSAACLNGISQPSQVLAGCFPRGAESDSPRQSLVSLCHSILPVVLQHPSWDLSANPSISAPEGHLLSSQLELLGAMATSLGPRVSPFLPALLYPLLEQAASPHPLARASALRALVGTAAGHPDLPTLLRRNFDVLADRVAARLRPPVDPPRALVAAAVSEVLLTAPGRDVNRAALEDLAGSLVEAFDSRVAEGSILPILTVFLGVASCFVVFLFINSASSGCTRVLYHIRGGGRRGGKFLANYNAEAGDGGL